MTTRHFLAMLLTATLPLACGEVGQVTPEEEAENLPLVERTSPAPDGAAASLSEVDPCELMPAEEVAEITGSSMLGVASRQDLGESQGCTYGVTMGTGDPAGRTSLWAHPVGRFQVHTDVVAAAREDGREVTTAPVEGLGETAYVVSDQAAGTHTVHVLEPGSVSVVATAESPEHAIEMARRAVARLASRGEREPTPEPPTGQG